MDVKHQINPLSDESGLSLLTILVSLALTGILVLIVASTMKQQTDRTKLHQIDDVVNGAKNEFRTLLDCRATASLSDNSHSSGYLKAVVFKGNRRRNLKSDSTDVRWEKNLAVRCKNLQSATSALAEYWCEYKVMIGNETEENTALATKAKHWRPLLNLPILCRNE